MNVLTAYALSALLLVCRQPPYDDVGGKPHYLMHDETVRRHLIWNSDESGWWISPVCTYKEGGHALALSCDADLSGQWMYLPDDLAEHGLKITMKGGEATGSAGEDDSEAASMQILEDEKTLSWNESNHECMLFSNATYSVYFLSTKPKAMRASMHPLLLQHLTLNRITVGDQLATKLDTLVENVHSSSTSSLGCQNKRFYHILGALTDRNMPEQQADLLLKGEYALTWDTVLKMLAVFVRIRCGIPVILMGECGCGKVI